MAHPLMTALMDVFPNAMRALAAHTLYGSQKHNPGGTKHWAFHVSTHHADACVGHLMERGNIDPESGVSHSVAALWRAAANLETELINAGAKPGRSVDFERGKPLPKRVEELAHPAQRLCVAAFKRELGNEFPVPVYVEVDDGPSCWGCGGKTSAIDVLCAQCELQRGEDGHE